MKPDLAVDFFQESETKLWAPKYKSDLHKSELHLYQTSASCHQGNLVEV